MNPAAGGRWACRTAQGKIREAIWFVNIYLIHKTNLSQNRLTRHYMSRSDIACTDSIVIR